MNKNLHFVRNEIARWENIFHNSLGNTKEMNLANEMLEGLYAAEFQLMMKDLEKELSGLKEKLNVGGEL